MGEGVFTSETRIRFVKGWLTGGVDPADGSVECGNFTNFPLEITGATIQAKFDKIAEIFYRAKMAQFTENNLSGIAGIDFGVTSGTISPRVMWSDGYGLSNNYLESGYYTFDESPTLININFLQFLGDQYSENYWDSSEYIGFFRDIGDNEIGMWIPATINSVTPPWNNPVDSIANGGSTKTAFTWFSFSASGTVTQPSIPIPWVSNFVDPDDIYESLQIYVSFSGRIGVVYAGVDNDLYHPDNRFFLEMSFEGNISGGISFNSGYTQSGFVTTSAEYIMRLSSGDLSCPLNGDSTSSSLLTGSIVHEAIEWFPYAKGSPATPVWNSTTGAKL